MTTARAGIAHPAAHRLHVRGAGRLLLAARPHRDGVHHVRAAGGHRPRPGAADSSADRDLGDGEHAAGRADPSAAGPHHPRRRHGTRRQRLAADAVRTDRARRGRRAVRHGARRTRARPGQLAALVSAGPRLRLRRRPRPRPGSHEEGRRAAGARNEQDAARRPPHAVAATRELLEAVLAGTHDPEIEGVEVDGATRPGGDRSGHARGRRLPVRHHGQPWLHVRCAEALLRYCLLPEPRPRGRPAVRTLGARQQRHRRRRESRRQGDHWAGADQGRRRAGGRRRRRRQGSRARPTNLVARWPRR